MEKSTLYSRRRFINTSLKSLVYLTLNSKFIPAFNHDTSDHFYFAVIADTHIIDDQYSQNPSSWFTNLTIRKANQRFARVRDMINASPFPIDMVFITGDFIHNHPSSKWDYYFENHTRFDEAKAIMSGFNAPVFPGLGNHDYNIDKYRTTDRGRINFQLTHDLFREKFNVDPYYCVRMHGYNFIHLNNFLGRTFQPGGEKTSLMSGSYGEEQLNWLEGILEQRKPSFIFTHFPLQMIKNTEIGDYGITGLLKKYQDSVLSVFSGHTHIWFDFKHKYGPNHIVSGSTRMDDNSYMIVRVNRRETIHDIMNYSQILWQTPWARPFTKPRRPRRIVNPVAAAI